MHDVPAIRRASCSHISAALAVAALLGPLLPFGGIAGAQDIHGTWTQIAPVPPVPSPIPARTSFVMVLDTSRDRLVVFGGDPNLMGDVWVLPLAPGSLWSPLLAGGPSPSGRYGANAIYDPLNDRLIVFGGYDGARRNDLWALNFSGTPQWTQLFPAGPSPGPRQDAATVYDPVGQRMVIFGGFGGGQFLGDVWALSLAGTPTWSSMTPSGTPPPGRDIAQSAFDSSRRRLIVFGGWNGDFLGDTWALDLDGAGAWSPVTTTTSPPPRREGRAIYDAPRDRMIVFGGWDGGYLGELWQLTLAGTPDWSPLAAAGAPPVGRAGARDVYDSVRDRFLVFGGYSNAYLSDTWALALSGTPQWSALEIAPAPPPASGITARRDIAGVYRPEGRDLHIFGGAQPSSDTDETWRLDLDDPLALWQLVDVGATRPTARHGHRSAWDPVRHRMLVFGGYDVTYLNDLWAYTPAPTPHWEQLSTLGTPPIPRMYGGFAYDPPRDRVLVVAGHPGFSQHPTGFLMDVWELPLSGVNAMTWAPVATLGTPPSPHWIYGMQYDPPRQRLLFFGGVTEAGRPDDAWTLSLAGTPTWTQLAPLGAPPPGRSDHAMIYDPLLDRMVVFGGFDGSFRNDAWALNLSGAPQWTQVMRSGGSPVGRDIIQAVYDSHAGRMVVYGGWNGTLGQYLNDTWALQWGTPPVPVLASLIESFAEPGRVALSWFVPHAASLAMSVERREGEGFWRAIGTPGRSGLDRVSYQDVTVSSGHRYGYRLAIHAGGETTLTDEVLIEVPTGYAFQLVGARPNPTTGERVVVEFALPRSTDARLDLIDVTGRQVATRELGMLGPGRHQILFRGLEPFDPGIYLIRLWAGKDSRTAKVLVIR